MRNSCPLLDDLDVSTSSGCYFAILAHATAAFCACVPIIDNLAEFDVSEVTQTACACTRNNNNIIIIKWTKLFFSLNFGDKCPLSLAAILGLGLGL